MYLIWPCRVVFCDVINSFIKWETLKRQTIEKKHSKWIPHPKAKWFSAFFTFWLSYNSTQKSCFLYYDNGNPVMSRGTFSSTYKVQIRSRILLSLVQGILKISLLLTCTIVSRTPKWNPTKQHNWLPVFESALHNYLMSRS